MAADQRGSISTAPAPSRPARPGCPSSGRSPWQTKGPRCTQTITWTVLATGTRTTTTTTTTTLTRTRCPGLRWCERDCRSGYAGPSAQSWVVFFFFFFFFFLRVCVLIGLQCVSCAFIFQFSSDTQIYYLDLLWRQGRLHGAHLTDMWTLVCAVLTRDWIKEF